VNGENEVCKRRIENRVASSEAEPHQPLDCCCNPALDALTTGGARPTLSVRTTSRRLPFVGALAFPPRRDTLGWWAASCLVAFWWPASSLLQQPQHASHLAHPSRWTLLTNLRTSKRRPDGTHAVTPDSADLQRRRPSYCVASVTPLLQAASCLVSRNLTKPETSSQRSRGQPLEYQINVEHPTGLG
jgi:hypothetical protein